MVVRHLRRKDAMLHCCNAGCCRSCVSLSELRMSGTQRRPWMNLGSPLLSRMRSSLECRRRPGSGVRPRRRGPRETLRPRWRKPLEGRTSEGECCCRWASCRFTPRAPLASSTRNAHPHIAYFSLATASSNTVAVAFVDLWL